MRNLYWGLSLLLVLSSSLAMAETFANAVQDFSIPKSTPKPVVQAQVQAQVVAPAPPPVPVATPPAPVVPAAAPSQISPTRIDATHGNPDEVKKWLKDFDLVVVVDKGLAQTLTAYRNSGTPQDPIASVALKSKISSGVEDKHCNPTLSKTPDAWGRYIVSEKLIWRHTPTGYYVPKLLDADHYSSTYGDAHMPNAVGWDSDNGLYTHEGDVSQKRQSHGCVRMPKDAAQDLFTMVLMTGGPIGNVDTDERLTAKCPHENPGCDLRAARAKFHNYFNDVTHGKFPFNDNPKLGPVRDLKSNLPRLQTYSSMQDVPVVNKMGVVQTDPQSKAVLKAPGLKTLYIVRDSDLGTSKEVPMPADKRCNAPYVYQPGGAPAPQSPFGGFFGRFFGG